MRPLTVLVLALLALAGHAKQLVGAAPPVTPRPARPAPGREAEARVRATLTARLAAARLLEDDRVRQRSLTHLAQDAADAGETALVRQALAGISSSFEKQALLWSCVAPLAEAGEAVAALELAREVPATLDRQKALEAAARSPEDSLIEAVATGNVTRVRRCLRGGADPNGRDRRGNRHLLIAAEEGNVGVALALLEAGATLRAESDGTTPLHLAAEKGRLGVVRALLAQGAAVDARTSAGTTPLMEAAHNGQVEVVKELLARGAEPRLKDQRGRTAYDLAREEGHDNLAGLLVPQEGLVPSGLEAELLRAAAQGKVDVVKRCLEGGVSPDVRNSANVPALLLAAQAGSAPVVKLLLEKGANPRLAAPRSVWTPRTPLEAAVERGHADVVRLLLEHKADPRQPAGDGSSLLRVAAEKGHARVAELLLAAGANVEDGGSRKAPPLIAAAHVGHLEVIKVLLRAGASRRARFEGRPARKWASSEALLPYLDGGEALLQVVSGVDEASARELLELRSPTDATDDEGRTPLLVAAQNRRLGMVKLLLEHGADPNATDRADQTALMAAAQLGSLEMVRVLLAHGALVGPTGEGKTASELAAKGGFDEIAELLRDYAALADAVKKGAAGKVKELLAKKLDPNVQTAPGEPLLLDAVRAAAPPVVRLLLEAGANPNSRDRYDTPVLIVATKKGNVEVVKLLVEAKADLTARDREGHTALEHASKAAIVDLVRLAVKK